MEPLTLLAWIVLVGAVLRIGRRAFGALGRSSAVMGSLFVPPDFRLPWPRGVQESDEPWGWHEPDVADTVATAPVAAPPIRRGPASRLGTPRSGR